MIEPTVTVDRYGVIGYPVTHSRSPVIHRLFALQTGQQMQYELLQVTPEKLETAVRQFQRTGGKGLNVTVPHKRAVLDLVDHQVRMAGPAAWGRRSRPLSRFLELTREHGIGHATRLALRKLTRRGSRSG